MEYIELGKIAEFVRGPFGGSLKKNIFVNDGIAVYEQQHAIYNQFDQIRYFIDENKFNEMKRFEVRPNDIIMSCSGTMGKVAIVPKGVKIGIINQALLKITPSSKLDSRFLEYYMKSTIFFEFLNADAKGAAIKNVASVKELKKIPVMVISLEEQRTIVAKIDQAFSAIDQAKTNIEKNIANAKELFQSKLNQIFSQKGDGWEEKMIIELCKHKSQIVGGPFGSNLKVSDYKESGIPILRLQNIGKGYFINKDIKYISEEKAEELSYHSFKSGDIVLAKLGIPIGKTCMVPEDFDNGIVVADVVRIRPNIDEINYDFLKHFLNSDNAVSQLTADIKGATRPRVNIDEVRNLKLSIPSISIQIKIVEEIDNLEKLRNELITKYQQKLANLEELKKSILEKAFKGELSTAAIEKV